MSTQLIDIIKRQTNYSEDVIKEKLTLYNNDFEKIILEYNNYEEKTEEKTISTNQNIFKVIRENFDNKYKYTKR